MRLKLSSFLFLLFFSSAAISDIVEEIVTLPVSVKNIYGGEFKQEIIVTIFRDNSRVKSPWLVLNHGRPVSGALQMGRQRYSKNSKYFVEKGFLVLVPTRVGYGPSGGPDVEYSGACNQNNYPVVYEAAVEQVSKVIDYAKNLPYVNSGRGLIVGQSFGGVTSIAASTLNKDGLMGVINFAGGGGGNPETRPGEPCGQKLLKKTYRDYGEKSKVPSLWLYSSNDRYWGNVYPREWFKSYKNGADKNKVLTRFVSLPPYKEDGHSIFTGNPETWKSEVEIFLKEISF
jgi:dienelactone hydrolase